MDYDLASLCSSFVVWPHCLDVCELIIHTCKIREKRAMQRKLLQNKDRCTYSQEKQSNDVDTQVQLFDVCG